MIRVDRSLVTDLPVDLIQQLNAFSLFSSPDFASLWNAEGGREVCWTISDSDKIKTVLTGVEFRFKPFVRFQAMPDGCYTQVVSLNHTQGTESLHCNALLHEINRYGYAKIYIADFWKKIPECEEFQSVLCNTLVVDVSSNDWKPPDQKLQSEIRKAEREGVKVRDFNQLHDMDSFFSLMNHTEKRHGRQPKYSREFFYGLAKLAQKDQRIQWKVVEHEGELAASHIYFIDNGMVFNWQVYFDKKFSFLKPNQLITFDTVRSLSSQGITKLNLGASPHDAEGLTAYKEKWGGEVYSYPLYTHFSLLGRLA